MTRHRKQSHPDVPMKNQNLILINSGKQKTPVKEETFGGDEYGNMELPLTLKKEKISTEELININLPLKKEPLDVKGYLLNRKTGKKEKMDDIVLTKREESNLSEQKAQCDVCTKEYS